RGGELAQLGGPGGWQLRRCLAVAGRGGVEESGDFGHAAEHTPGRGARRPKTRARRSRRRPPASGRLPAPSGSPPVGEELVELPGREPRDAAERLLQVAVWVEPESPAGAVGNEPSALPAGWAS